MILIQIPIIFEDDDIIVINKPAGLIVNRADTTKDLITIQHFAEEKIGIDISKVTELSSEFERRGGVVHRLDKETSGCMILAKNEMSFIDLQKQFKTGEVSKTYTFLAHGKVAPKEGTINVPIGRLPWNRMRFGVLPQGREAQTEYKILEYKTLTSGKEENILTLGEAYPKTGRTHQIRVHMLYLGFPLFADSLYAGRKTIKSDRKILNRHFLHASKISFNHPRTKSRVFFEAPLSPELIDFLKLLH
jgi:23S rRNA pseudouridine1911/1915/1917 synthase